jgi:hypothetical protein
MPDSDAGELTQFPLSKIAWKLLQRHGSIRRKRKVKIYSLTSDPGSGGWGGCWLLENRTLYVPRTPSLTSAAMIALLCFGRLSGCANESFFGLPHLSNAHPGRPPGGDTAAARCDVARGAMHPGLCNRSNRIATDIALVSRAGPPSTRSCELPGRCRRNRQIPKRRCADLHHGQSECSGAGFTAD